MTPRIILIMRHVMLYELEDKWMRTASSSACKKIVAAVPSNVWRGAYAAYMSYFMR